MNKRMSWEEIKKNYADNNVGLSDIIRDEQTHVIISAVVKCSTKEITYEELLMKSAKEGLYIIFPNEDKYAESGVIG